MVLDEIIAAQKRGESRGITSICSANPWVLKTAMRQALKTGKNLLIESTCNQVNQFGGYTGMAPADFVAYVRGLARETGLGEEQILLGGDHLGPNVWQNEPAETAMQKSAQMVRAYIQAGYTKIHLDASMKLVDDDPAHPLEVELAAKRTVFLAHVAEETCAAQASTAPRYIIGTEVPIPGGATSSSRAGTGTTPDSEVAVTSVQDVRRTIEITRRAFWHEGLDSAWERVAAVVVQPGLEFGDDFILDYQAEKAGDLSHFIEAVPGMVYEAHSTDYQAREALRNLVSNHFAILKVGPGLTFALREAIFALAMMEKELFPAGSRSNLTAVLENAMLRDPRHWQKYFPGTKREQAFKRKFSLSDRSRYYWPDEQVQAALAKLLANMGQAAMPYSLLSQYAPQFSERIRLGEIENRPEALLGSWVEAVLEDYEYACQH